MAVIAVSVVATVLVLRPESGGGGGSTPAAQNGNSEFASANDTGPANIISEDPTCEAWMRVARDYSAKAQSVGWANRDPHVPASAWSAEQRTAYETVGKALADAAEPTENLAKQTPHRVMRELYGQFVTYSRAFSSAVPTYEPSMDGLVNVAGTLHAALSAMCGAVDYKSVQSTAPLVAEPAAPTSVAQPSGTPEKFVDSSSDSVCKDWLSLIEQFDKDTAQWVTVDANISASEWTPEQKSIYEAVVPVMRTQADSMEKLGRSSNNPILEDFAVLSSQYMRAYVVAIPHYTASDNFLSDSSRFLTSTIVWACRSAS
ncbi:hypothetical protein [Mycolicibacterium porcinum]|uniref:hypothetical protein n=1 Tax=Mycolicibacterium porcinum TaxID=39693 RepID=UPI0010421575|nr:hypothetical protein [Mycolicibacterium porcinum]